jgi:hypothetical protein
MNIFNIEVLFRIAKKKLHNSYHETHYNGIEYPIRLGSVTTHESTWDVTLIQTRKLTDDYKDQPEVEITIEVLATEVSEILYVLLHKISDKGGIATMFS